MSYFQKHNKLQNQIEQSSIEQGLQVNSNIFNKNNLKNPKDSYLKNFKKSYCKSNQQNVIQCHPQQANNNQHKNTNMNVNKMSDFSSITELMKASCNKKQNVKGKPEKIYVDDRSLTDSTFNNLIRDPEHSMEEMLNSSINQFERFLEQQKNQQLIQQNTQLKRTLAKFKHILRQKLQNGLKKQKQEVTKMLAEYVQLITKLLHDKQEMSGHIQQLEDELKLTSSRLKKLERQFDCRVKQKTQEKDEQILVIRKQLQQVESIIQQYQEQNAQQIKRTNQLQNQVQRLSEFQKMYLEFGPGSNTQRGKHNNNNNNCDTKQREQFQKRIQGQSQKIQTLLELLQKAQQQSNSLKEALSKQQLQFHNSSIGTTQDQIKRLFEQQLEQMEIQHQQEFRQYDIAIKQNLKMKDNTIERFQGVIQELKRSLVKKQEMIKNMSVNQSSGNMNMILVHNRNKSESIGRSVVVNSTNPNVNVNVNATEASYSKLRQ